MAVISGKRSILYCPDELPRDIQHNNRVIFHDFKKKLNKNYLPFEIMIIFGYVTDQPKNI